MAALLPEELVNRNTEVVIDKTSGLERMVYLGQGEQRSQSSATSKGRPNTPGPKTPGKGTGKDKGNNPATSRHNKKDQQGIYWKGGYGYWVTNKRGEYTGA